MPQLAVPSVLIIHIGNKIVRVMLVNHVIDSSGDSHEAKVLYFLKMQKNFKKNLPGNPFQGLNYNRAISF